jgi:hypothetical protein
MALVDDGVPLWRSETEKRSFIDAVLASPTDASPLLGRSLSDRDRRRQRYGSDRLHETSMPAPTACEDVDDHCGKDAIMRRPLAACNPHRDSHGEEVFAQGREA